MVLVYLVQHIPPLKVVLQQYVNVIQIIQWSMMFVISTVVKINTLKTINVLNVLLVQHHKVEKQLSVNVQQNQHGIMDLVLQVAIQTGISTEVLAQTAQLTQSQQVVT